MPSKGFRFIEKLKLIVKLIHKLYVQLKLRKNYNQVPNKVQSIVMEFHNVIVIVIIGFIVKMVSP